VTVQGLLALLGPDPLHPAALYRLPLHLGGLHAQERLLVLLIAFGPFVVLAVVVFLLRRR
jgi:hypothetical protein